MTATILAIDAFDVTPTDLSDILASDAGAGYAAYSVELGDGEKATVIYSETDQRGAICFNADSSWTSASSVEDIIKRFENDEMSA